MNEYIKLKQTEKWVEFLEKHKVSYWFAFSKFVDWSYVKEHPDKPYNWECLTYNKSVTFDTIMNNRDKYPWVMKFLAMNPNVTWEIIQQNRDSIEWDYTLLLENPNITWDIIQENLDLFTNSSPDAWSYISNNLNITMEIVDRHPEYNWDWRVLSAHKNVTWDDIYCRPNRPWDIGWMSRNPNITWDIVGHNLHLNWDWNALSAHPNMTKSVILNTIRSCPWNLKEFINNNPNIDWEFIALGQDFPWKSLYLSKNPNLTWEIIDDNPQMAWHPHGLGANEFTLQLKLIETEYRNKWRAAKKIQHAWYDAISNPNKWLGRKALQWYYYDEDPDMVTYIHSIRTWEELEELEKS